MVKTLDGKEIKPKKMVLHEQDSKVLLLNDHTDKKIFYMDLEKGKVIDELVIKDSINHYKINKQFI